MKKNIVIAAVLFCFVLLMSACEYHKCAAYGHYSQNYQPQQEQSAE